MNRRYDIDWVRVIAIGLLIIYHSAIAFQPWGAMIAFTTNKEFLPGLWFPMAVVNVWRIPLLFFVSGMGVYFAMQSRTPGELIVERTKRILVPYIFGVFVIVPIQIAIWRMNWSYVYNPAHLWFLGNIFVYVLIFAVPFYYLKKNHVSLKPIGMLIMVALLIAEVLIINPRPYELYAMTLHGFVLGMIMFFFGYMFASGGMEVVKWKYALLTMAMLLAVLRLNGISYPYLIPVESLCWILTVLAMANRYLNKESKTLRYLSEAAYPVYIVHMIFQNLVSALIFPNGDYGRSKVCAVGNSYVNRIASYLRIDQENESHPGSLWIETEG
jgi:glucan biosynthesis protein C